MDRQELKQIQLYRQHLTNKADKLTVVRDILGVQAQFMSAAMHSLRIRCSDWDEVTVGTGLVKNWTIRGTMHVFAEDDLPLFIHCGDGADYLKNEWSGRNFWNSRDRWALTPERQSYFNDVIVSAIGTAPMSRDELREVCRMAGMTQPEEESLFDPWGGGIRLLCERGFLNYTVSEKKELCLAPHFTPIPEEGAMAEICRRYLTHMAPATVADICYYLKCTKAQAKTWLGGLPVKTVVIEGEEYFYLGDIEGNYPEVPRCIFLAGFDQLMLAYEKQTSIYLPNEYLRGIFNTSGIVMPAVLLDGTVCGKWKRTKNKLEVTCFRELTAGEKRTVTDAAEELWDSEIRKIIIK